MKPGRNGTHPESLEELFPRNIGTNRNIRCHRHDHVLCIHCKLQTVFRLQCVNQIIYMTLSCPAFLLSACTVKHK